MTGKNAQAAERNRLVSRDRRERARRQAWWRSLTPEQQAERIAGWQDRKTASRITELTAEQMRIRDLARDLTVPFDPRWIGWDGVTDYGDPPWAGQ